VGRGKKSLGLGMEKKIKISFGGFLCNGEEI